MRADRHRTRASSGPLSRVVAFSLLLLSTSGCLSHRIRVRATDDEALVRARSLFVVVRPLAAPGARPPAALEPAALTKRIEDAVHVRGYATDSEAASDLVLEAAPAIESVSRRTWTSDTDATAPRLVAATDLVFILRAVDRDGDLTLWSSEARLPMPVDELPGHPPDTDALWNDLVDRALAKLPKSGAR